MTNACPVLSVCQEFVSLCCFFRKRGSFFLSWIYLEALAWSESSVCHYCLFLISHVHLQDFVAIANQWLQSGVWPQDGEKENRSNSAKEHNCCGGQYIPQKMGWSLPSNISFVCDCWWLLRVSWYSHGWVMRPSEFLQAAGAAWTCWTRDSGPGTGILA